MIHYKHLKADMKQIAREPIMLMLIFMPVFFFILFKLLILFLFPRIETWTGFDIVPYYSYLLSGVFVITPQLLGTVTGFLMIDDRDENIYSLMSVTPMGYSGYMANRLLIPFTAGIFYTLFGYVVLSIYSIPFFNLLYISLLAGLEGIIASLMLFQLSKDKVQGLTYAKTLGIFIAFCFADLLNVRWVSVLASLIPFYWPSRLIRHPATILPVILALAVHLLWLFILIRRTKGRYT